jgi:hypothetical protein
MQAGAMPGPRLRVSLSIILIIFGENLFGRASRQTPAFLPADQGASRLAEPRSVDRNVLDQVGNSRSDHAGLRRVVRLTRRADYYPCIALCRVTAFVRVVRRQLTAMQPLACFAAMSLPCVERRAKLLSDHTVDQAWERQRAACECLRSQVGCRSAPAAAPIAIGSALG